MRIGIVIYGSLETLTGGFLYNRLLVEHLRRRGHSVSAISLPWRPLPAAMMQNVSPRWMSEIARQPVDLLVEDALCLPSLFGMNRWLGRRRAVPVVGLVHMLRSVQPGNRFSGRFFGFPERCWLSSMDGIIANSRTTLAEVKRMRNRLPPFIVAPPGGDRLGNGVTPEWIERRALQTGPLQMVFLGNLTPNKGLGELLAALTRLADLPWRLTVIGSLTMDREYTRGIRKMIADSRLGSRVRLAGALDGPDLAALLNESHLMAMPFSRESFGIACLEGMAFGLPAIGSTLGAAREMITHGKNGFLIPPGADEAPGRCIRSLVADRRQLTRMGIAALKHFKRHPRWQDTMAAVADFLENVFHNRSEASA